MHVPSNYRSTQPRSTNSSRIWCLSGPQGQDFHRDHGTSEETSEPHTIRNKVRRQSGFPTFIMARRHYVRTSATHYRCGDNRNKVKTFVTSAWYHWRYAGPYFNPYLISGFASGRQTLLYSIKSMEQRELRVSARC